MADEALTGAGLLRSVGLLADGPAVWGRPFAAAGPGVFVIELPSPPATAPIELTRVGKWIERVPTLHLDGRAAASRPVAARIASFWIPSTTVLYVGSSTTSVAGRVAAIEATVLGERRPYAGGHWLKLLTGLERARIWWARTDATEEYEDALFGSFADAVPPDDRARLPDQAVILPFANLRSTAGDRKAHGLTGYLVPEDAAPRRPAATHVRELPPGDADGASGLPPAKAAGGTTRRAPRPKPPAPRTPPPARPSAPASPAEAEGTYLSAEGIARLQDELNELTTVRRPEVIARIKSAKELGDLKENADYTAAREEQSFLEGRIAQIEGLLRTAVVIEAQGADGRVHIGSSVSVEEVAGEGEVVAYRIVGSAEADPAAGRISNVSPVGRALMGRAVGETVTVTTPRGDIMYRIVAIE
ncbi:MAG TPA: transcription elongation factor GreA [Candidatus Limnocylindrales bacterium]|nr:transcription elongation factor GreA [Candidatus Limnocylindrales bacterium]